MITLICLLHTCLLPENSLVLGACSFSSRPGHFPLISHMLISSLCPALLRRPQSSCLCHHALPAWSLSQFQPCISDPEPLPHFLAPRLLGEALETRPGPALGRALPMIMFQCHASCWKIWLVRHWTIAWEEGLYWKSVFLVADVAGP